MNLSPITARHWMIALLLTGGLLTAGNASAYLIDFEQGGTTGGSLTCGATDCVGVDIPFTVLKADTTDDGLADLEDVSVDALMNFDTGLNTITLAGSINDAGISITDEVLLSGSFDNWDTISTPGTFAFFGSGPDEKSTNLLSQLGIPTNTEWAFFTFQLATDANGGPVNSADIQNVTVPTPGILGLMGIGLMGIAVAATRRRG